MCCDCPLRGEECWTARCQDGGKRHVIKELEVALEDGRAEPGRALDKGRAMQLEPRSRLRV